MKATAAGSRRDRRWVIAVLIFCATAALYLQVAGHRFLFYDDNYYVTENAQVRSGLTWSGVQWAVTTFEVANWHPLTWLSHMLDVELFGLDPGPHHLVNAVLHAATAAALFLVIAGMTGAPKRSAVVALLFAAHPLHTESVAWLSERKDLLSTLFGFLMLGAYVAYAKRPGVRAGLPVLLFYILSLLSKPMWVTAPLLLLLLDFWPLQRYEGPSPAAGRLHPDMPRFALKQLLAEKAPLMVLSLLSAALTIAAQHKGGALASVELLGFGDRAANALVSYVEYLAKTFQPVSLSPFYPYPVGGWPLLRVVFSGALLAALTVLVLLRRRRSPWAALGWLWFLVTLFPVIGIVQVGAQAMADRYSYLPLVGIFIAVVWEGARLADRWPLSAQRLLASLGLALLAALSLLTWRQIGYWSDQETLFKRAIAVTEDNWKAHLMVSQSRAAEGRFSEALGPAAEAVRLNPAYPRARNNLGFVLYRLGRVDEAIGEFQRALVLQSDYAEAHLNLGIAYGNKGMIKEAMSAIARGEELRRERGVVQWR